LTTTNLVAATLRPAGNRNENSRDTFTKYRVCKSLAESMAASSPDSTRLLFCAALGLLMAPGLALLHGGAASRKDTRSAVLVSLATIPLLGIPWLLFGYGVLDPTSRGIPEALRHVTSWSGAATSLGIASTFSLGAFGLSGSVAACAIMIAAFAGRLTLRAHVTLLLLWSSLVYAPVAHWVWATDGWLARLGVLDFGGGVPIHLAAGTSSLVCAAFAETNGGVRADARPHPGRVALTLGAVLLSLGCFGSMAGASWVGRGLGDRAFIATAMGAAGGGLGWLVGEAGRESGESSGPGVSSGLTVGLAAIAAAGGYVSPLFAFVIGVIAGGSYSGTVSGLALAVLAGSIAIVDGGGHVSPSIAVAIALVAGCVCYATAIARRRLDGHPSRSAFGVHALGGLTGIFLTGILAHGVGGAGVRGALFGNVRQLAAQLLCCGAVAIYAGALTLGILKMLKATIGLGPLGGVRLLEVAAAGSEACVAEEPRGRELYTE
jgi:Amt family ammonium transporter